MKLFNILFIIFSWASLAQEQNYKIDHKNKNIYFIPRITINIDILKTYASSIMSVGSEYLAPKNDTLYQALKNEHPAYKMSIVNHPNIDSYRQEIKGVLLPIGKEISLSLFSTFHGPRLSGKIALTNAETDQIEKIGVQALELNLNVSKETISFSHNNTLEEIKVHRSVCQTIFLNGDSAFNVFNNYYKEIGKLEQKVFKYQSTFEALKENIFNECIATLNDLNIRKFKDLLNSNLYEITPTNEFISAKTFKTTDVKFEASLGYYYGLRSLN